MVAGRVDEGSSIPASSSIKRLFIGVKQPNCNKSANSDVDRYPLRLRTPDLSNCHVCGSPINPNNNKKGNKDKFRTLDSQWRIVIICNSCFVNLQSAKNCSYCFSEMCSELGVSCRSCNRGVHRECLPMYGRLNLCSDIGSFTCIDCWVPRSINRKRIGGSSSVNKDKDRGNSRSLEDAAKDAETKAEMKRAEAVKSREKALEKAVAARRVAEMAAGALDLAVAVAVAAANANEESKVDGGHPMIDDAELALRLHRAINSSRRTFKNVGFQKNDFKLNGCSLSALFDPGSQAVCEPDMVKKRDSKLSSCSLSARSDPVSVVEADADVLTCENSDRADSDSYVVNSDCSLSACPDPGSQTISVLETGTNHLTCERFDKAASKPSLQIGTLDHGSSSDLGALDHKGKAKSREASGACMINDEASSLINSGRVLDDGIVEEGWILALPAEEKQSKCSSKVTISSGNHVNTESVSRCIHQGVLTYKRGTRFRSSYSVDPSLLQKKSDNGAAMFLRKYSRRHHGRKMYIRKYCRRQTKLKHIFDPSTNFCAKTFHLKSDFRNCTDEEHRSLDFH